MASRRALDGARLLEALVVLRDAPGAAGASPAWRVVLDTLGELHPGDTDPARELRQVAAIHVNRGVAGYRSATGGEAVSWLRTIVLNAARDEARRARRDPVHRALRERRPEPDGARAEPLDRLPTPEPPPPPELAARYTELLLEHVVAHLHASASSPLKRQGDLVRAQATLLRVVFREDLAAIVDELGIDPTTPAARIYKWVERGRAILLAALDRWEHATDTDEPALAAVAAFRVLVSTRRADAGQERPDRRGRTRGAAAAGDARQSATPLRVLSVSGRKPRR